MEVELELERELEFGAEAGGWELKAEAGNPEILEKYSFTPPKSAFWAKTAVRLRFAI